LSLAQIGEFSFIIATLGLTLNATSAFLYPLAVTVSALTTLFTPYLIRAANPLERGIRKVAPEGLRSVLHMYTAWLQSLRFVGDRAVIAAMVRRILLQAFVNLCLVAAIFGGGAYFARRYRDEIAAWIPYPQVANALIWGASLMLSLAFLVAAYRKLKALAMMLAEVSVRAGRHTARVQRIVAEVLPAVSIGAMMVLVSALSSSILPPAELLLFVLAMGALILALLWRTLVKLHSRLQIALLETLQSDKDPN
jgi:CPA2 family monovalent cation:H+ antiporter-2